MPSRSETRQGNTVGAVTPASNTFSQRGPAVEQKPPASSGLEPVLARVLSHYRLEERLASGPMGFLYRATDLKSGRATAIKVFDRHLVAEEGAKARFLHQARAASDLDDPNIAKIQEIGEEDGQLFIAMAVDGGETLEQRLERGPVPFHEARAILRQLCFGLEAAHNDGIVHQHLNPASVLITGDGTVKIFDFGLSKLVAGSDPRITAQTAPMAERLPYLSPEQLRGAPADARSDLWSLGALGYQMLAGTLPFQASSSVATSARILNDEPTALSTVSGVPDWFAGLVSQLLRKNPAERPESVSKVLRRLEDSGNDCASPVVESAGVASGSTPVRFALALGIGLLVAAGVFYCHWPI